MKQEPVEIELPEIEIGLPDKFEFTDHGYFIRIVRKWFGPKIIVFTFFTILWNSFLFFSISELVHQCAFVRGPLAVKMILFPTIHLAIGIYLIYYVIRGFLNKTIIRVDNSSITVKHTPLSFFWENKTLNSSGIRQVYSKESSKYNRGENRITHYELRVITHDKKDVKLLSGLESPKQVLFIEQAIEKFLRIEDKCVKGEIGL